MSAPYRRGRCPGLSDPMQTGDGLLARLRPTGGSIALDAFAGLCAAARTHGNGILEITARGNIQIRGLTPSSAPAFAAAVAALGIDAMDGVSVTTHPLAGLDPGETIEAVAVADTMRRALAASRWGGLGPKVSVIVDGGGALHLDALPADIRLRAEALSDEIRLHVALGGDAASATQLGSVASEHAIDVVRNLLDVIAALGPAARARDVIRTEGEAVFRAAVSELLFHAPPPPLRPPTEPIHTHALRDGRVALGIALAFGHSGATELQSLVDAAERAGADSIRAAPGRVLLLVGLAPESADSLRAIAERLGFIVHADDPRRRVAACAGAPICASARIATRALGPAIAKSAAPLLDGRLSAHVSGCAKGCADPGAATFTIVGTATGCGVIVNGSARDIPLGTIAPDGLPDGLANLVREVERMRQPGERAADVIGRLGARRVAAMIVG